LSGPRSASRREFRSPPRFLGAELFNPRFLPPTPLCRRGSFPDSPAIKFANGTTYSPPLPPQTHPPPLHRHLSAYTIPPIESRSPAGSVFKARAAEAL